MLLCQFFVLAENRFWFYILLMYLGLSYATFGIPRYIKNIENILRKSIYQSVLRPNLASKKKTLASSKKHKNINITFLVPLQEKN